MQFSITVMLGEVKNSASAQKVESNSMQLIGLFWHEHVKIYATFPENIQFLTQKVMKQSEYKRYSTP